MPRMKILNSIEQEAFELPPAAQQRRAQTPLRFFAGGKTRTRNDRSVQAAYQELHHLLELSLPIPEAGGDG